MKVLLVLLAIYAVSAQSFLFKFDPATDIVFNLYTLQNIETPETVTVSGQPLQNFNPSLITRFIIHDWWLCPQQMLKEIKDAYLSQGSFNVITVDWTRGTRTLKYKKVQERVRQVGEATAAIIQHLIQNSNAVGERISIIGNGVGAHAAGFAGKSVSANGGPQLNAIVGLDPTALGYSNLDVSLRLHIDDALYVQTIHTSREGIQNPIGHASFYPNYGLKQPGCEDKYSGLCSHVRAWEYFVESITATIFGLFIARDCLDYSAIEELNCGNTNEFVIMGGAMLDRNANGVFWLRTNPTAPYSKGVDGILP